MAFKSYLAFKPNMLDPADSTANRVTAIRDPFGNSYGYSTAKAADPRRHNGLQSNLRSLEHVH